LKLVAHSDQDFNGKSYKQGDVVHDPSEVADILAHPLVSKIFGKVADSAFPDPAPARPSTPVPPVSSVSSSS
jgi:hypothetical protein